MKEKQTLFAGGCFWCVEAAMRMREGVTEVISGYAIDGGDLPDGVSQVGYEDVTEKRIRAREAILVSYRPEIVGYAHLVGHFFSIIDPYDAGGQFHDRGYSYTTAIYAENHEEALQARQIIEKIESETGKTIVTVIENMTDTRFFPAEENHQKYKEKNPEHYAQYYRGSGRETFFAK
jgi:methionine-S-sulfoxide reductase